MSETMKAESTHLVESSLYEREAKNLANVWTNGNEGARTCILAALEHAHVAGAAAIFAVYGPQESEPREIPFLIYEAIRQAAEAAVFAGERMQSYRDVSRPMARQRAKDECVSAIWKAFDAIGARDSMLPARPAPAKTEDEDHG
jgi:hypothetical protein